MNTFRSKIITFLQQNLCIPGDPRIAPEDPILNAGWSRIAPEVELFVLMYIFLHMLKTFRTPGLAK